MKTNKSYSSSQQSPIIPCISAREYPNSVDKKMFLDDFSQLFSISLAERNDHCMFYNVIPEGSALKNLLNFKTHHFLNYDFDKLLSHIMYTLVFSGKAYVEVVVYKNSNADVIGITLQQFDPLFSFRCFKNTYFGAIQKNKRFRFFKIANRNVIVFKLSDLGFSRYFLRRLYKKLSYFDILKVSNAVFQQKTGFDFAIWKKKHDYQLLKVYKNIGWYARDTDNQYMGEAYQLYRTIQFQSLQKKFLDYFLRQINTTIQPICKEINIEGILVANSVNYDYDLLLKKLQSGDLNYSQLGDIVLLKKPLEEP